VLAHGAAVTRRDTLKPGVEIMTTECRGRVGAVTIVDEVLVPHDATCTFEGTSVEGDIVAEPGSVLYASGVAVTGGIRGDAVKTIVINDCALGNDLQVNHSEAAGMVVIRSSRVAGNVQLQANRGAVRVAGNHVSGNVEAQDNTGGVDIADNDIAGTLQCQDNDPAAITTRNLERNGPVG
jgi:hypothetical protein